MEIMASWQRAEPSERQKEHLAELLLVLTDLLNKLSPLDNPDGNRYIVDVFGSAAWGGGTGKSGDVDLVIIVSAVPLPVAHPLWKTPSDVRVVANISKSRKLKNPHVPKIYNVHVLRSYLENLTIVKEARAVPAFTPIVKFKVPHMGFQCDICTNDLGGWYNSALILAYCEISPFVLRPMIHTLKLWLQVHNLNDPSGQTGLRSMSSYCLTLMSIAYLQHIGALPNLQAGVVVPTSADPRIASKDSIWLSWGKEQGDIAHVWFKRRPPPGWQPRRPSLTAAEAVRGFFQYFSLLGHDQSYFNPNSQIVSILNGGISSRRNPVAPSERDNTPRGESALTAQEGGTGGPSTAPTIPEISG
ncbi:hypothetical protein CC85DRAFT_319265 [Cutaneotrichosporon oleaginosum]|uniref:Poly(A) RNA polymerase mitochondrial-like central palm domain-containing protein n=1 Tax=Cutaneotrichosporon oleaginosum TaxID=879819 RepID=A0A0J1B350_9TREE|nr:uncharacterized protein CC85DRAFT_319265 [Cutaneotrichosporon oleaginosum]KLT42034.1 hypothetical protein CC85DRAFT_319265 [Cutaneotrichosporon oleaginosum]TXT14310.1 hypothetical protein COLE_00503 [Cutaneotrichosporon oleaginosum]